MRLRQPVSSLYEATRIDGVGVEDPLALLFGEAARAVIGPREARA
jgi:hypothetical protein